MDQQYFDEAEAAVYTRVTVGTLRKANERGELPKIKVGRTLVYRRVDLDEWMNSQLVGGDAA